MFELLSQDRGASLVEYALVVVLIAIVALTTVRLVGTENVQMWSEIGTGLSNS